MSEVMTPDETNELVERLRGAGSEGIDAIDRLRLYATDSDVFRIDFEDAAELTELVEAATGAIVQQRDQLASANSRITELTAEVERLREALGSIINGAPENDPELDPLTSAGNGDDVFSDGCRQEHFRLAQIARTALSHDEGK